jgi:hypothetical protein
MKRIAWADVVLGLWLILSPWVLGYSLSRPVVMAEDLVPGILLIATSLWILRVSLPSLRLSWLQALGGLWLIVGSFVLLFSHMPHAAVNGLIVGIVVMAVYVETMWMQNRRLTAMR